MQYEELNRYVLEKVRQGVIDKEMAFAILKGLNDKKVEEKPRIAIIGVACRFPGADNFAQYWDNIRQGKSLTGPFPMSRRKDTDKLLFKQPLAGSDPYLKGGYLKEIDRFDAGFFKLTSAEAKVMDPCQRIFLEISWEAIEDAGYGRDRLKGSQTGVYTGIDHSAKLDYLKLIQKPDLLAKTGSWSGILASRISYMLDLHGPSLVIDTACSSSLIALHTACRALQNKECDLALAGGINLFGIPKDSGLDLIESGSGRLLPFDRNAGGMVWGEGAGAVLLKPLSRAREDGDHIYAIVLGGAVNNNGASNGITSPNALAQTELLLAAWKDAGIHPETLSFIEAHGTGTAFGDPLEIKGLTSAFRMFTDKKQFCGISSVKANIGHTVGASGMAALLKTVAALKHQEIPPALHFTEPNPFIDFCASPVYISDRLTTWEKGAAPRRAGISSLAFSGTNCHIVLEEADEVPVHENEEVHEFHVLTLSAREGATLADLVVRYRDFVSENPGLDLARMCYTANTGRNHFPHRLVLLVKDKNDLFDKLEYLTSTNSEQVSLDGFFCSTTPELADTAGPYSAENLFKEINLKLKKLSETGSLRLGDWQDVCKAYVQGADIEWSLLYQKGKYLKMSLPVYPFNRQRYWVETDPGFLKTTTWPTPQSVKMQKVEKEPADQSAESMQLSSSQQAVSEKLLTVWREVLEVKDLKTDDNFFENGGHSMHALHISTLLRRHGLMLNIKDILQHPTVKAASSFARVLDQPGEEVCVRGEVPLIPNQLFVIEKNSFQLDAIFEWNIVYILFREEGFEESILRKALTSLTTQHDALRMIFTLQDGRLISYNQELDGEFFRLETFDLKAVLNPKKRIQSESARISQEMNLLKGPLFRAGLFKTKNGDHLTLCIHHFIADGISGLILLEDLALAYCQIREGQSVNLPAHTDSFSAWAQYLQKYASSQELASEYTYWKKLAETNTALLPRDGDNTENKDKDVKEIFILWSKGHTEKLIQLCNRQLAFDPEKVMLCAIARMVHRLTGNHKVMVERTLHGRDGADSKLSLQRTVGWFSYSVPVILELLEDADVKAQITHLKRICDATPHNGIGYTVLEQITMPADQARARFKLEPEIMLIYQGEYNIGHNALQFSMSSIPATRYSHPEFIRARDLLIKGIIFNKRLVVSFTYNRKHFSSKRIKRMTALFRHELSQILSELNQRA